MPKPGRLVFLFSLAVLLALPLFAQNTTIRGKVTLADGSPLPGVTVAVDGTDISAVTDAEGRYELAVPDRAVRLTASLEGFQTRSATVVPAPGGATQDFVLNVSFGQEITVGSRAIGAEAEKAVPVDVIPQEQIESAPSTETSQVIQKIAPSFNFPRPTITDGTDTVRPATLRGLGPDQLLVMLNGKRRHASALVNANNSVGRGSSGVDLNAIPVAAIQSIEILRDGAAAQYGSDAIAGVINIVLKSDAQPLQLQAKAGMTTHADGQMIDTSLSGGWKIGRGALFAAGEYRNRYETNRAGIDPREQVVPGDAGKNAVPQPNHHWGDSYARDLMLFTNFNLPLTDDGRQVFYAFGGFSNRHGSHGGFYRRALQAQNHPQIYPLGFLPLIEPRVVDGSLTAGARGQLASWFYDVSAGYGMNEFDFYVSNSLNTSLGPTIPPNQTRFYAGTLGDTLFATNVDLSRQFRVGALAGPLNVAVGVEYRRDGYTIEAGEPNSYIDGGFPDQYGRRAPAGAQVFPGFRPSNEIDTSRNSKAVYVDLEGDVLEKLRIGLAGRFEDFSDFGSTSDGKLTVRYSPMQTLIFRGSASTGFRAPSLSQSYYSAVSTNFLAVGGVLTPFEVGTYPVNSAIAISLGATPLQPETSTNLSAGVVFQPLANLELTADYFAIDIEDRIVFSGNFTGDVVRPFLEPFGVTGARFFTNAIDTETRGYDLVANYQRGLGNLGRLDLSAAYTNNETEIVGIVRTPPKLEQLRETLFDRIERRRIECGQPKDNVRLMQHWAWGNVDVTTRQSRYGEFCSFTLLESQDQDYGATWLADLEVEYEWRDYEFAVGAENLFDAFPDLNRLDAPQSNLGIFTYPSHSPFGMNGRFVYTRISYRF